MSFSSFTLSLLHFKIKRKFVSFFFTSSPFILSFIIPRNVKMKRQEKKKKKKEESRITSSITRKKQSFHRQSLWLSLNSFFQTYLSTIRFSKLKRRINYTSYNSGDIVSNTIKYHHGTIKKTGTQTVINKGASMINELSRGPILTSSKRSSLLLAVDAYVIHGLLCIHFVGVLRFLSRRIWLVYSWWFYSICAVQNERTNSRILEEIIDDIFPFIRDFRNLFWTGLSCNGRK